MTNGYLLSLLVVTLRNEGSHKESVMLSASGGFSIYIIMKLDTESA